MRISEDRLPLYNATEMLPNRVSRVLTIKVSYKCCRNFLQCVIQTFGIITEMTDQPAQRLLSAIAGYS